MQLTSVRIKNFRGYRDSSKMRVGDLTALVAPNDAGKSSVLEALDIFFEGGTVKLEMADLCVDAEESVVEIACTFADLPTSLVLDSTSETSLASEHLLDRGGELEVVKRWKMSARPKAEVLIRAHHPTADGIDDLLLLKNADLKARYRSLGEPGDASLANNVQMRHALYEATADLSLELVEIPVNAADAKSVWDMLSIHLPVFALFQSDRPSRDTDSEVQDPMKLAIETALADPEIAPLLKEVQEAVKSRAVELATRTGVALAQLDANLAGTLVPEFKAEPKWSNVFGLELSDHRGVSINKRGSGVRRLVLVSFFRAESERRRDAAGSANIIYAVEEPETSQHPANQRVLMESLAQLSGEGGCQVLLTTHSPGLAGSLQTADLRTVQLGNAGPELTELDDDSLGVLSSAMGVVPDSRVRVLVCVEGPHDVAALRAFSRALNSEDPKVPNLGDDERFAFIPLGGSTLQQWVDEHHLKALNIPEVHIYDSDVDKYKDSVAAVNARSDGSWAVQTRKLEMENYLHADAIYEALGVTVEIADDSDVPALVGAAKNLSPKRAKRYLSDQVLPLMDADRIDQRDPEGELRSWFARIESTASTGD
jgi:hypothetical protein